MAKSIPVVQKKRGRPKKVAGLDPVTAIRLPPELRAEITGWANQQDDKPGLTVAIRRLIQTGLDAERKKR
jgi:hypothetical protein